MSPSTPLSPHAPGWDVLIVGGGVIGSAVAYFLTADETRSQVAGQERGGSGGRNAVPEERPDRLRVAVVEPDPTYARSSTALSVGGIRLQFSTPENILLSRFSSEFFRAAPERLAVGDQRPDLAYTEGGYLFLATDRGMATLRRNLALQTSLGAEVLPLDPASLKNRYPWLEVSDLAGAALGLSREGWLDPYSLLQALRQKAQVQGVEYLQDRVVGLEVAEGMVERAFLKAAGNVVVGTVVNAAGPRAADVARMAGIQDLPVHPRKRMVYQVRAQEPLPGCPMVIDPSGVYFRPEGKGYLCGVSPPTDEDPDTLDLEVGYDLFREVVWPALAHRVPAFDSLKLGSAWAGHYAVNTADRNAVLGPHPNLHNFIFASGFSGHGLQHAPGIGRGVAELVLHGRYRTLDLSRFGFRRFAEGRLVLEANVV